MRTKLSILVAQWLAVLLLASFTTAQDFKKYPGAVRDDKASQLTSSSAKEVECQVYTTGDNYDAVYSYYKALYKEIQTPFPIQRLPNGKAVKWSFFILDGAKDLSQSKHWMKIQRPYIGNVDDEANFQDIRDITVIQTIRTHTSAAQRHSLF